MCEFGELSKGRKGMNTGSFFIVAWILVSMIVHIWTCVAANWAAMLIIGLVCFPVGVIHGTGIILGIW